MSEAPRVVAVLTLLALLGACDTVKRIPSQVGELGSRVGGWFSFGGGDTAIADDPQVIVLPLAGTDWLGRPALAEEIARLLRATTPNARAGTAPDGRSRTIEATSKPSRKATASFGSRSPGPTAAATARRSPNTARSQPWIASCGRAPRCRRCR